MQRVGVGFHRGYARSECLKNSLPHFVRWLHRYSNHSRWTSSRTGFTPVGPFRQDNQVPCRVRLFWKMEARRLWATRGAVAACCIPRRAGDRQYKVGGLQKNSQLRAKENLYGIHATNNHTSLPNPIHRLEARKREVSLCLYTSKICGTLNLRNLKQWGNGNGNILRAIRVRRKRDMITSTGW